MKFKVLTATPVMDTTYGNTFEWDPAAPADPENRHSVAYNVQHWLDLGLVSVVEDAPAETALEGASE
jgi:hypothetical protein